MKGASDAFCQFFKIANFGNCCNTLSDENKHCPNMSHCPYSFDLFSKTPLDVEK